MTNNDFSEIGGGSNFAGTIEEIIVYLYRIETKDVFQVAESAAWGNATYDACNYVKYIGKNKMEVDY